MQARPTTRNALHTNCETMWLRSAAKATRKPTSRRRKLTM
jgi:hypothetical protein